MKSTLFCKTILSATLLSWILASSSYAQPVQIPGKGTDTITFPNGEASWADRVVVVTPGNPAAAAASAVPEASLGRPDYSQKGDSAYTSLGRGGQITLEFTDNRLVDIAGDDLYIFEVGPQVEDTKVEISQDGVTWIDVGTVTGSTSYLDISPYVNAGEQFRFVRLTDDPDEGGQSGRTVGADIDAVGAIGSVSGADINNGANAAGEPPRRPQTTVSIAQYFDAVAFYIPGNGNYTAGDQLPQSIVGQPDQGRMGGSSLRLGEGGSVVMLMADHMALNQAGKDLYVYGQLAGPLQVDVSLNGRDWTTLGEVNSSSPGIDLGTMTEARYVRLIEKVDGQSGTVVDAVGATEVRALPLR